MSGDIADLTAAADAPALGRVLLAVVAMHEPDARGRCPHCLPEVRGWRRWRRSSAPCPTTRVVTAHLRAVAEAGPHWTPA